jgi:hypothetical protein
MSRAFSPCSFAYPKMNIVNADKAAGTFWTRAQNLNKYEQSIQNFGSTQAFGSKLCGFCQACFKDVPTNGETKRTEHRRGYHGLCRSAKYCPLCAFYSKLILGRRGDATFPNNHVLVVYTRNIASQLGSAYPIMNVGLEMKSHCMFAMAFCPDLSKFALQYVVSRPDATTDKVSKRAIWITTQPELRSRVHLFRKWLEKCEKGHANCSQHGVHGQPSRLLQIDTSSRLDFVRLTTLNTTSIPVRYAALSHCWGLPDSVFLTTTSNLKQLHTSIPMKQLPKNFLDAIQITKALGLTYLWIDSLCIIQDSPTDWAVESAKMNVVYLNAVVTIAASSSNDAHGGCFLNLQQPPSLRLRLPISHTGSNVGQRALNGTLRSTYASPFTVGNSPINKRGWVFQEMVLSSRILHFTEEQVYWQCREAVESEDSLLCESDTNWCFWTETGEKSYSRPLFTPNLIPENDLSRLWWSWITDYSSRTFTKPEDRLYACAGIVKFYQQIPRSSMIVLGLLRDRLLTDLHWRCGGNAPNRRIRTSNLPSWTWLGWEAPLLDISNLSTNTDWPGPTETTIISVDVVWSGEKLTTPLKKAELRISGRVLQMRVGNPVRAFGDHTVNLLITSNNQITKNPNKTILYSAIATFDGLACSENSKVYCLELEMFWMIKDLRYTPDSSPPWSPIFTVTQNILVLKLLCPETNVFERIGVGTIRYDDAEDWSTAFDDIESQAIRLV